MAATRLLKNGLYVPVENTTAQYRAGLFDGEGSITAIVVGNNKCVSFEGRIIPLLSMGNTDLSLIGVMQTAYGGCVVVNTKLVGHKQAYTWTIRGSKRVYAALSDMMPYLIGKAERARNMMIMLRTYNRPNGSNRIGQVEAHTWRACLQRLRLLNKRGDA